MMTCPLTFKMRWFFYENFKLHPSKMSQMTFQNSYNFTFYLFYYNFKCSTERSDLELYLKGITSGEFEILPFIKFWNCSKKKNSPKRVQQAFDIRADLAHLGFLTQTRIRIWLQHLTSGLQIGWSTQAKVRSIENIIGGQSIRGV